MLFKLKVAEESYNDEKRVKVSVNKMEPMDYVSECQVLFGGGGQTARAC